MRNSLLIRYGDFLYIHHFSSLGSFDKRCKNGCFFFKTHVPAISLIVVLCNGADSIAHISCYQLTGCRNMISGLFRNLLQAFSFCAHDKNAKPTLYVLVSVLLSRCLYFQQLTLGYLV